MLPARCANLDPLGRFLRLWLSVQLYEPSLQFLAKNLCLRVDKAAVEQLWEDNRG